MRCDGAGDAKSHGLAWFLAGALAGGLVTWVVLGRDPAAEQVRATVERTVGHSIGVDSTEPPPKPKFEFYTLLPEMEVVVPDEDLAAPSPAPAESASTDETGTTDAAAPTGTAVEENKRTEPAPGSGHYILQVRIVQEHERRGRPQGAAHPARIPAGRADRRHQQRREMAPGTDRPLRRSRLPGGGRASSYGRMDTTTRWWCG